MAQKNQSTPILIQNKSSVPFLWHILLTPYGFAGLVVFPMSIFEWGIHWFLAIFISIASYFTVFCLLASLKGLIDVSTPLVKNALQLTFIVICVTPGGFISYSFSSWLMTNAPDWQYYLATSLFTILGSWAGYYISKTPIDSAISEDTKTSI